MDALFFIPFLIWLAVCIWGSIVADRLIAAQYESHRDAWERDGKPRGTFWLPADEDIRFQIKARLVVFGWLFETPSWVEGDNNARRLLSRYRWVSLFIIFGALPLCVLSEMLLVFLLGR